MPKKRNPNTNLALDTIKILTKFNKLDLVDYVTNGRVCYTFSDFLKLAKRINFYSGYGLAYVPHDLMIMGKNREWWMTRFEYDGAEA